MNAVIGLLSITVATFGIVYGCVHDDSLIIMLGVTAWILGMFLYGREDLIK